MDSVVQIIGAIVLMAVSAFALIFFGVPLITVTYRFWKEPIEPIRLGRRR